MEAALLQIYAPRDPLREVLTRAITFRQFRVMVEGIPRNKSTPIGRLVNGVWDDIENLLWDVSTQLRVLVAGYAAVHRKEGTAAPTPKPLPRPPDTPYQVRARKRSGQPDDEQRQAEADLIAALERNTSR